MKYSFINIFLCCILWAGNGCTGENAMNGYGEIEPERVPLAVHSTINSFYNLDLAGGPSTRTPLELGNVTQFSKGDAIGIFAVRNGAIVDAVNNIKLTFVKTGLETGDWNPPAGTQLYWSEGVTYIAYYPYKDGITINATLSADEIIRSLAQNDKLQPVADQSTPAQYTACDLMTAIGEYDSNATDPILGTMRKAIKLKFSHQFALLVLKPQARFKYISPTPEVFTYRSVDAGTVVDVTAKNVKLNGVDACKMDDGSYRAIVFPKENQQIAGSYTTTDITSNMDKNLTYSGKSTNFLAGNCYTLEVTSPLAASEKERSLAPGDFVFFNTDRTKIEICPGDLIFEGGKIPGYEQAVGMVITCDKSKMTDAEGNANGWKNAYVMGLETIKNVSWGTADGNTEIPYLTRTDPIETYMNGYTDTEKILAKPGFGTAFEELKKYRDSNPLPNNICSPWFIPSIGQWYDVLVNICGKNPKTDFNYPTGTGWEDTQYGTETIEKLTRQLSKVDSSLGDWTNFRYIFWCSTQYKQTDGWIVIWHFEVMDKKNFWDRIGIKSYDKTAKLGYNVRLFFAF